MRISLDYDGTYTADPATWDKFIALMFAGGHDVRVVTMRSPTKDRTADLVKLERKVQIIYTDGAAKRFHLTNRDSDWVPEIWIEDKPEAVLYNSPTSAADLRAWREERNEGPSL